MRLQPDEAVRRSGNEGGGEEVIRTQGLTKVYPGHVTALRRLRGAAGLV